MFTLTPVSECGAGSNPIPKGEGIFNIRMVMKRDVGMDPKMPTLVHVEGETHSLWGILVV